MSETTNARKLERLKRRKRSVRAKLSGTPERPRMSVYKSLRHLHIQLIDDLNGATLVSATTAVKANREAGGTFANKVNAKKIGKEIAEKALEKNISTVAFDRNGRKYHGVVKEIAEAARAAGLKF